MARVVRLRLDISYDGTDFSGWAIQPDRRTVAGTLTDALQVLLRAPVQLVVAGRTDAGVHALGQVAHVDVETGALSALAPRQSRQSHESHESHQSHQSHQSRESRWSALGTGLDGAEASVIAAPDATGLVGLLRRLAGVLPPDVRVRAVATAVGGFDARFSALRRHYRYRIGTADWGVEPRDQRFVLARRRALSTDSMDRAAQALIGLHDFAAFCRPREGATTTRELQDLTVRRTGDEVRVDVVADAFCHSMVRALVGSLLAVGEGRVPIERPALLLAEGKRTSGIHIAPAHGLTLMAVDYPPEAGLAQRAELTRTRRPSNPGRVGDQPPDPGSGAGP